MPSKAIIQRKTAAGIHRAIRGPSMLPTNIPALSGVAAVQSTSPKTANAIADITTVAPTSMFFKAFGPGQLGIGRE
jgi:hypothetical protein